MIHFQSLKVIGKDWKRPFKRVWIFRILIWESTNKSGMVSGKCRDKRIEISRKLKRGARRYSGNSQKLNHDKTIESGMDLSHLNLQSS